MFINDRKKHLKYWVQRTGAQRTFQISSRTLFGYLLTSCPGQELCLK